MIDLRAALRERGADPDALPYVIRVLAENALRAYAARGSAAVSADELASIVDWRNHVGEDLPLFVSRVILPDSSGIPVLQDLAALREAVGARGGDARRVDTMVPLDFVVDHSLQVDRYGTPDALAFNMARELARNAERYEFLRWCQANFNGITVYPPGSGIIHQVNLERAARVVCTSQIDGATWAFPDFVIGGDSHTPMVNALGVLGWGVGGIDAEAALLGLAYVFRSPRSSACAWMGPRRPASSRPTWPYSSRSACARRAWSIARGVLRRRCRTHEHPRPRHARQHGARIRRDLRLLRHRRRDARVLALDRARRIARRVGRAAREGGRTLSRCGRADTPIFAGDRHRPRRRAPTVAGPSRPQDAMRLPELAPDFRRRLALPIAEGGFVRRNQDSAVAHGAIGIAAITSCTNTSNPSVMIAAGLVARNCVRLGVAPPAWVKTSLAPGSHAVTRYLDAMGLLQHLRALGFEVVGYGCTTCAGKSGPLEPSLAKRIEDDGLVAAAVLSGNRNFPGRIHKLIQANYLMAPPLVVAYAVAGRWTSIPSASRSRSARKGATCTCATCCPTTRKSRARGASGRPRFLCAIRSDRALRCRLLEWARSSSTTPSHGTRRRPISSSRRSSTVAAGDGIEALSEALRRARVLVMLGASATTDHISPSRRDSGRRTSGPVPDRTRRRAEGLQHLRRPPRQPSRDGARHVREREAAQPPHAIDRGRLTMQFPERKVATVFDAAMHYREQGVQTIVLAGAGLRARAAAATGPPRAPHSSA
jgi:aconitate hydratase